MDTLKRDTFGMRLLIGKYVSFPRAENVLVFTQFQDLVTGADPDLRRDSSWAFSRFESLVMPDHTQYMESPFSFRT